MRIVEKAYARSPLAIQNVMVSIYGAYWRWLRFGPGYEKYVEEFAERDRYSADDWQAWTTARLGQVLNTALSEVPHYREEWTREEKEAARACRLASLPILDKEPVRESPRRFVRDKKGVRRELVFHTSGSTGTPIAAIWTVQEYRAAKALREARSAQWAGTSFRFPRATFSGRMVEPKPESLGPFHRFNRAENQVYFSAFHLREQTAGQYVEALWRHSVEWLTGYAVSFFLLARFMIELGLEPPPLKAVVTTSEKLTSEMREIMQEAYRCPVFEEYSTVENAVFASECERGRLHVSPDSGIVEILRPDGTPCRPGEAGEVVATCLLRAHQPLIRFRLGDMAMWSDGPCPCGRSMPILEEVVGRLEDVVTGPDGRQMVRFHGVFVGLPGVQCAQVRQEKVDLIRVLVIAGAGYGPPVEQDIRDRIHERLGNAVVVSVEQVEDIPRGARGKFEAVVSNVAS